MALIKVNMNSSVLNMGTDIYVILPQSGAPDNRGGTQSAAPFKTLYLLHGHGGDYTEWLRNTSIERYASKYQLAVVLPSGDNSFWSNLQNGMKYQEFITKELINYCESWFPLSSRPEDRFIGGISMGGYGALRAALNSPELYSKAVGISSATDISLIYHREGFEDRAKMLFGEPSEIKENGADLFAAADRLAVSEKKAPKFYLTCGEQDNHLKQSEKMVTKFNTLGFDVTFCPADGAHDWQFGDSAIKSALGWLFGERKEV